MAVHHLGSDKNHNRWNNKIRPVLEIDSGDTVVFDTMVADRGQVPPGSTVKELLAADSGATHTITGPVAIRGAMPGQVLAITIEKLVPGEWGVNYSYPGSFNLGWLPDEFPDPSVTHFVIDRAAGVARWNDRISIPLRPHMGIMGVAPVEDGEFRTYAPGVFGGNMDCTELGEGAILYLPVQVPGALFSTGDAHAAMGDGEINVTAIETSMTATMTFRLLSDKVIIEPEIETADKYITTAFGATIDEAAKKASRFMINYLVRERGLSRQEAYTLCSVGVDLIINQVVDEVMGVRAVLSKKVFTDV